MAQPLLVENKGHWTLAKENGAFVEDHENLVAANGH